MNLELAHERLRLFERRAIDTRRFAWMGMTQGEDQRGVNTIALYLLEGELNPWGERTANNLTRAQLYGYDILDQYNLLREALEPDIRLDLYYVTERGLPQVKKFREGLNINAKKKGWRLIYERDLVFSSN